MSAYHLRPNRSLESRTAKGINKLGNDAADEKHRQPIDTKLGKNRFSKGEQNHA